MYLELVALQLPTAGVRRDTCLGCMGSGSAVRRRREKVLLSEGSKVAMTNQVE